MVVRSFADELKRLGRPDDPLVYPLLAELANAQKLRFSSGSSNTKKVTRSTALSVLGERLPMAELLSPTGLDWHHFLKLCGLDGYADRKFDPVSQVEETESLEAEFYLQQAMNDAAPDPVLAVDANLIIAILQAAVRDPNQGKLPDRLITAGAELDTIVPVLREGLLSQSRFVSDLAATKTEFLADDAELQRDLLGRGPLAISIARFLHNIWMRNNGVPSASRDGQSPEIARAGFVFHLDAPWGGGKTTFANFIAQVLDPITDPPNSESFLWDELDDKAKTAREPGPVFLQSADDTQSLEKWHENARRPWIVVKYNAWENQHLAPPWWNFYRSIRRQCLTTVSEQGVAPYGVDGSRSQKPDKTLSRKLRRREIYWHLKSPKISKLSKVAGLSAVLLLILFAMNGFDGKGYDPASLAGSVLADSGSSDEGLNLGGGDPFRRFRLHYQDFCKRVKRPILIVIDDIDRCEPPYIVNFLSGLQTILRSPRVVYMVLGDQRWIERAFAVEHAAMEGITVGYEQTLGGRFVEKALQLSLTLPNGAPQARKDYLQTLLAAETGANQNKTGDTLVVALSPDERKALVEESRRALGSADLSDLVSAARQVQLDVKLANGLEDLSEAKAAAIMQFINNEVVKRAGHSAQTSEGVAHQLIPLSFAMPSNPRQVKRIINTITVYQQFALAADMFSENSSQTSLDTRARWRAIALWIVLKLEWPETWRTLWSNPWAAQLIAHEDPPEESDLAIHLASEDERSHALAWFLEKRKDARLREVLHHIGPPETRLDEHTIIWLKPLIPSYDSSIPTS